MIEFYAEVRWTHIAAVLVSGSLFALRFLLLQAGWRGVLAWPFRYFSYTVDTVLLTAALMLATMLQQYPFVHAWLTAKVLLLVAYIVLGSLALRGAVSRGTQIACGAGAIALFAGIISVARARHPLGALASLL